MQDFSVVVAVVPEDGVYRRLLPNGHVRRNGTVSPTAFKKKRGDEMVPEEPVSVDLIRLTTLDDFMARSKEGAGAGELRVSEIQGLQLEVVHTPDRPRNNYAHCDIVGDNSDFKCAQLADMTVILRHPFNPA